MFTFASSDCVKLNLWNVLPVFGEERQEKC